MYIQGRLQQGDWGAKGATTSSQLVRDANLDINECVDKLPWMTTPETTEI